MQSSKSRYSILSGPNLLRGQSAPKRLDKAATQRNELNKLDSTSLKQNAISVPQSLGEIFVHTFFYAWYGTPDVDKSWIHWNHPILPHWDAAVSKRFPTGSFNPELGQIGSNFHPAEAVYSSANRSKIDIQVSQIAGAGIGVAVVSWWGRKEVFPSGKQCSEMRQCWDTGAAWYPDLDTTLDTFMDACARANLKVSFHIEPYPGRSEVSVRDDLMHIINRFGQHKALYRLSDQDPRPVVYIYDSYQIIASSWSKIFSAQGDASIRKTPFDVVALGLWVEQFHGHDLVSGGFDGFYTYFASEGFVYGSSRGNWPSMIDFANRNGLLSSISVGPGYCDERIRPWNQHNTQDRKNGEYYREAWNAAASLNPSFISITSWNEWHEGTQIEDCMPASIANAQSRWQEIASSSTYRDYGIGGPSMYRQLTLELITEAKEKRKA